MYDSAKLVAFAERMLPTLCVKDALELQIAINHSGMDVGKGVLDLFQKWFTQPFIDNNFKK